MQGKIGNKLSTKPNLLMWREKKAIKEHITDIVVKKYVLQLDIVSSQCCFWVLCFYFSHQADRSEWFSLQVIPRLVTHCTSTRTAHGKVGLCTWRICTWCQSSEVRKQHHAFVYLNVTNRLMIFCAYFQGNALARLWWPKFPRWGEFIYTR